MFIKCILTIRLYRQLNVICLVIDKKIPEVLSYLFDENCVEYKLYDQYWKKGKLKWNAYIYISQEAIFFNINLLYALVNT